MNLAGKLVKVTDYFSVDRYSRVAAREEVDDDMDAIAT